MKVGIIRTYYERLIDSLWHLSPDWCDPDAPYDRIRRGWARSPCSGHGRSYRMLNDAMVVVDVRSNVT